MTQDKEEKLLNLGTNISFGIWFIVQESPISILDEEHQQYRYQYYRVYEYIKIWNYIGDTYWYQMVIDTIEYSLNYSIT